MRRFKRCKKDNHCPFQHANNVISRMYLLNIKDGMSHQGEEKSPINAFNSNALIVARVKGNMLKKRCPKHDNKRNGC